LANLHEHQRPIAIAHHEVDLAAAAAGRPIIAGKQAHSLRLQVRQRAAFRRIAFRLGGHRGLPFHEESD
jgi:hypothetical protein